MYRNCGRTTGLHVRRLLEINGTSFEAIVAFVNAVDL
jgi:hypothetical protein